MLQKAVSPQAMRGSSHLSDAAEPGNHRWNVPFVMIEEQELYAADHFGKDAVSNCTPRIVAIHLKRYEQSFNAILTSLIPTEAAGGRTFSLI